MKSFLRTCYFVQAAWVSLFFNGFIFAAPADDSSAAPAGFLRIRVNSASFFPYSGKILNLRPTGDVMVTYDVGPVIGYAFESMDIAGRRSDINYFQTGLFRKVYPLKNFTVMGVAILEIPQNGKFYDTPYWVGGMNLTYAISKQWTAQNTTLLVDGFDKAESKDIINRFNLAYTASNRWETALFVWSNSSYFDHRAFHSAALMLTVPVLGEGKKPDLRLSVLYLRMLARDAGVSGLKQGINVSLTAPLSFR